VEALLGLVMLVPIGFGVFVVVNHFRADSLLGSAQKAIAKRDFLRAYDDLKAYLELQPSNAEIQFLAGRTARRCRAYAASLEHLERAEKLGWGRGGIILERTLLHAQKGELQSIEGNLQKLVDGEHPESVLILEALIEGYLQTHQLEGAFPALDRLLKREPNHAQGLLWRGWALAHIQRWDEARVSYRRALEILGDNDLARTQYAEVLLTMNQFPEALGHYERLARRKPWDVAVRLGLAACYRGLGRSPEALSAVEALLAQSSTLTVRQRVQALAERAKLALEADDLERAERAFREALTLQPYDRELLFLLANCLEQRGQTKEAAVFRARHAAAEADNKEMYMLIQQIARKPDDLELRYRAGVIALKAGNDNDGLRWLRSVLYFNPGHSGALEALQAYEARKQARGKTAGPN
jgi:tetratricopeptide (TPR) repeat protein